ncbi:MAG: amidohydrolase family protein [Deltaproteobacteria bacterium]|nr:amidohydrolase family protein [Deltaproteobacteria bacterium]
MIGARLFALVPLLVTLGCAGHLPRLVKLPAKEPGTIFFEGVRVFDGEDLLPGPQDVLVRKGKIAFVGPAGTVPPPEGATRIPGAGRTLLPGLWDSHLHLGGAQGELPWDARLPDLRRQLEGLVYSGVTSAVDAGRSLDVQKLHRRIRRGKVVGPHLISFSRVLTKKEGHPIPLIRTFLPWPVSSIGIKRSVREIDSVEEAGPAVAREITSSQTPWVKIVYNSIPDDAAHLSFEELEALILAAHAGGRRVGVHVGTPREAKEAAAAGADLLMHTPWTAELTETVLLALQEGGAPVITTSQIQGSVDRAVRGELDPFELEQAVADPERLARLGPKPRGYREEVFSPEYLEKLAVWDRRLGENLLRLFEAGIPQLVGTDASVPGLYQGPALHRELEALVALGLPPLEVLRRATSRPAAFFEPQGKRGRVERGHLADLLLVEGNPLENITDTRRIVGVWVGGRRAERLTPAHVAEAR